MIVEGFIQFKHIAFIITLLKAACIFICAISCGFLVMTFLFTPSCEETGNSNSEKSQPISFISSSRS